MYGNFKTEEEKDEIARKYLEKRREKKKKRKVNTTWFPGPACKVSKFDTKVLQSGPEYSSIKLLKESDEWQKQDSGLVEACTVEWVRQCFEEDSELRIAKIPYLHGALWEDMTVSKDGAHPLVLCDKTGKLEVRLHEELKSRYRKLIKANCSDPAILMKKVTVYKSDCGRDFYAACSLQNCLELVAAKRSENQASSIEYPCTFPLHYGSEDLSEIDWQDTTVTIDLGTFPEPNDREGDSQGGVLLPRPGASDEGSFQLNHPGTKSRPSQMAVQVLISHKF